MLLIIYLTAHSQSTNYIDIKYKYLADIPENEKRHHPYISG